MKRQWEVMASGAIRIRVSHPLGGAFKPLACIAATPGGAMALADHWRDLRRRYQHGLVTREDVLAEAARHERAKDASGAEDGSAGAVRVRDLWQAHTDRAVSERTRSTMNAYGRTLLGSLASLSHAELTAERMEKWNRELAKTYAHNTIKNVFDLLAAAMRRAMRRGGPLHGQHDLPWDTWRPTGGREERARAALPWADIERLLHRAHLEDERDAALGQLVARYPRLCLLIYTGMRNAELAALAWCDLQLVSTGETRIHIRHQVDRGAWKERGELAPSKAPKGRRKAGRGRSQGLHPCAVEALDQHRASLVALGLWREDGPVFPGRKGEWRPREGLNAARLRALARRAGLDWSGALVTHALRHGFVTNALLAGVDVRTVANLAGHRDIATTWIYVQEATGQGVPVAPLPKLGFRAGGVTALLPGSGGEPRVLLEGRIQVPTALEQKHEAGGDFEAIWCRRREEALAAADPPRYVPRDVRELANDARRNARRNAIRREETDDASNAGMRAQRSVLGAWGKFLRRMLARELAKGAA